MATPSRAYSDKTGNVIYEIPFVRNKRKQTATTHPLTVWYEWNECWSTLWSVRLLGRNLTTLKDRRHTIAILRRRVHSR